MNTKISHFELKKLYSEHSKFSNQFYTKDCPPIETIHGCLRSEISKKAKTKVIKHVISCYDCFREVKFISRIIEEETKLTFRIGTELKKKNSTELEIKKKKIEQKFSFPKLNWHYASIIIFSLFVVSIIVMTINKNPPLEKYRGENLSGYELIIQSNSINSSNEIELTWESIPFSKYYIIEIFNESLYPIWKSNKIHSNQLAINPISLNIRKSNKYFCIITAFLSKNKKLESRLQEIKLQ